ncbi:MAG: hypothetical protein Q9223_004154 [Gallowayella weberi]
MAEAIQMQPLTPNDVQDDEISTAFPEINVKGSHSKKTVGRRFGGACKGLARDGIWAFVENRPSKVVPVAVPRAARQRSSLARDASITRQREEYEKTLTLRDRGNSRASSSRRFREMFRSSAHRPAPPKSFCTIIREEQQRGHGIYTATEVYNKSRRNSEVDSAAPGETQKKEKEMKKAKSMGQLSAADPKAGSDKGEGKMELAVRTSKSDANLQSKDNRDSGDSGYVSRKHDSVESARAGLGHKQKPREEASRSSSRYSQSESTSSVA